jgi:hypothetical protein
MNEDQFNLLIEKLTELTKHIEASIPEAQPTDTSDLLKSTKKDDKLYEPEKRKIRKIAKIFKEEFETLGKDQTPLKGKKPIMVELDKESFKMLRKTLISIIPEFEKIFNNVKIKTKETSGFFGTLFKGALGIVSLLNGLKGFVLTAGAIGLLFYVIKNIEKISKSMDIIFKSGKENLPEIGRSLKNLFLPFLQEAIGPINKLIDQLPIIASIFLNYFPDIRREITAFVNETDPQKLLEIGGAFLALYTAWKTIQTVKGIADAVTSPASAINNFNNMLKSINLTLLGATLVAFAKSFEIFSDTIAKYKDIDWETMAKAGVSLAALFGSLKAASTFIGEGDAFKALIASIVGGAGLAVALRELAWGIEPWKNIPENVAKTAGMAVAGLIASLGALTVVGMAGPLPALFGAAGLLAAEGTLILGLRGIAEMFKATMDTWEKLPGVFKNYESIDFIKITEVAGAITQLAGALALSSISGGVNTVIKTFTDFWGKITGQDNPVETIRKFESLNAQKLESVSSSIEKIFNSLDRSKNIDLDKLIKTVDAAKKLTEFNEKGNIVAVPPSQKPGVQEVQPPAQEKPIARELQSVVPAQPMANDFISRPGQTPLRFSAEDTIIGVKNPDKLNKNLLNELVKKMEDIRKEDRATLRKLSDSITKLSTTTQANNNVNMVNNSRNVTSITISPTTSKSYRDSRMV